MFYYLVLLAKLHESFCKERQMPLRQQDRVLENTFASALHQATLNALLSKLLLPSNNGS